MINTITAFQLGSSTVVTLPKDLGIIPGSKLTVERSGKKVVLKPQKITEEEVEKLVDKLSGGLKLKKHLTPKEMNDLLNEEYEDHKKVLPRR